MVSRMSVEQRKTVIRNAPPGLQRGLFALFLVSGFCGLLYQIVWIRLALSEFGVITPVVSVVVSVFMAGLALGSWLGGRWIGGATRRLGVSPLVCYAAVEAGIAVGAIAVPHLFAWGRGLLLPFGDMDSASYLLLSAAVITLCMLPWCFLMGVTYPIALSFIRDRDASAESGFSYLYLANVMGAMAGVLLTSLVLIELLGFSRTLWLACTLNVGLAAGALVLGARYPARAAVPRRVQPPPTSAAARRRDPSPALSRLLLFTTGFAAMALEIVWVRAFTPVLGTVVYAFSGLLGVYLLATWLGSWAYRVGLGRNRVLSLPLLVGALSIAALLPSLSSDPRVVVALNRGIHALGSGGSIAIPLALASIFPMCALLGYLTPRLVDAESRGDAAPAGAAYAVNIVGSILGPLAAAYLLLPTLGSRLSMLLLAALFLLLLPAVAARSPHPIRLSRAVPLLAGAAAVLVLSGLRGISYEEGSHFRAAEVRRDHTATVISVGKGLRSQLVVNGHGMTTLSPVTKMMAHLPLASLDHEPKRALVIAFGMGTTYRSLLSWDIDVTAVELVPSVVEAFQYYFPDASSVLADPHGRIVVDDGRRFLARSRERFDLITVDPPPPVEAAGSSLLYSEEFYQLVKDHLEPGGMLQQWFPQGTSAEPATRQAVLRSILNSFPHVRVFRASHGTGLHILASLRPISVPDAAAFAERLPRRPRHDLLEWTVPGTTAQSFFQEGVLDRELDVEALVPDGFDRAITDDRPFNEYFVLRRLVSL